MMKLFFSMLLLIIIGGCVDIPISKIIQGYYCGGIAGAMVYENITLPIDFYLDIPQSKAEALKLESRYFLDTVDYVRWSKIPKGLMRVDKMKFKGLYRPEFNIKSELSSIGPVTKYTSRLVRIKDQKLLSEVVTISRGPGWLRSYLPFPTNLQTCVGPEGDQIMSGAATHFHADLIRQAVTRKTIR